MGDTENILGSSSGAKEVAREWKGKGEKKKKRERKGKKRPGTFMRRDTDARFHAPRRTRRRRAISLAYP